MLLQAARGSQPERVVYVEARCCSRDTESVNDVQVIDCYEPLFGLDGSDNAPKANWLTAMNAPGASVFLDSPQPNVVNGYAFKPAEQCFLPFDQCRVEQLNRDGALGSGCEDSTKPFVVDTGTGAGCLGWKQTGGCSPHGPREPQYDKGCATTIESGWSGFCDCGNGRKAMDKG